MTTMTNRPSDKDGGPCTVWGDGLEPLLDGVSEELMKKVVNIFVDNGREDVYGSVPNGTDYETEPVPE
jgi:hypothetical protein